ncbi:MULTISPECIES: hypothetical protein [unclassified Nocardioides]|jgi:hypothetical protein|uniref:hypothetical protein n=1 Tax=unclassified Nocardioides TaxID=2615069 RepID=UPI0007023F23|nr:MULTISPECIES: hypothetical protein [unclassified Nocardioides]KRC46219.1 hypothetical protein ASE19_20405 [Nocardioides sp. Root79]KRC69566.1 hypothetical protein ASE20_13265 [Nocardioides sp. Root240]
MNTTHRVGTIRRIALTLLATFAALTGTIAATGQPAQAASYGSITGCFQATSNTQWGTYTAPQKFSTVYVDVWNGSAWVARATTSTGSNGCVTYSVQTGYYWHLRMDYYSRPYRTVGTSNWAYVGSTGNYNVGWTNASIVWVG